MRRAVFDAGLPTKATPYCFLYSFGTHLMEQGVARQNIQALLGYRDPKSMEVYLHVSNKSLMGIQSLFDRKEGKWKELTLSGVEFIRRFLMHVPPKHFVMIRHYGLLCSRSKRKKLILCRNLLGCQKYLSKFQDKKMPEILYQVGELFT